jgi:transcriptional regulator with XRE-family HTH domain
VSTAVRQPPHHDTLTCYANYRCRLPDCVERKNAWARNRDRALRAGTWQPLEDATPVRAHLRTLLNSGLTQQRIAALAGVPHQSISDLIHGRSTRRGLRHRTSPEFAAKILAVDPAASPARVDATGSHRRIRALVAAGWPLLHIGRQLSLNPQRPEQILRQDHVHATTRDIVLDGYPRLARQRPERRGVPKDKARWSRERARANRWPDPAYWDGLMDVIDDPDFEPLYGVTRLELVAQDAGWLMRTSGLTREQAANRLGVHKSYVDQAMKAHPQTGQELAA